MPQSKEEKVHDVFQSISGSYDRMNAIISFQRHVAWRRDTMKRMKVSEGASALDVCCGTADWTLALSEAAGKSGEVTGLDFSENMLEVGRRKVEEKKAENVTLIQGNAMELPFEDDTFDFVTIGFGLRNVPDFNQVIREMHRVTKPGGLVTCLETSQPTMAGFKHMYWFYFRHIMPLFGRIFARSYEEYSWLQESAGTFPDKEALAGMFREAGFERVTYKSYSGGAAASHFARKSC
ncbi:demethylmenaquinone methyltransferase [Alteribacter natronophilus]|uniref:demethylmenaquinone methyltransferase n=1 Tax=Alteribacter natronophilus TaxID=2583810 RepID=UPI00110DB68E|nr:demethylmenaquinone methyltransferase [Alteribacter natronophilus]TMW73602.1 demethylmenaquinone methyltransferase [Alteribacter natronophilus]